MNRVSQAGTGKVKPISILMKQEMMGWQWHQLDVCKSFAPAPDKQRRQHLITQFFTDQMPFVTLNQH